MNNGFLRVATVSPDLIVANCSQNAQKIISSIKTASKDGASLIVLPQLCITGSTCGDLFFQSSLQSNALDALNQIAEQTSGVSALIFVGLPFAYKNSLYNCACAIHCGKILAFIPQVYPSLKQKSYFSTFDTSLPVEQIQIPNVADTIYFGTNIIFEDPQDSCFCISAEVGNDLFTVLPPSTNHCAHGATINVNLSSLSEIAERKNYRRLTVSAYSNKVSCAYIYCESSFGESSTDDVYAAHNLIAENGKILKESKLFGNGYLVCDVDCQAIVLERQKKGTFTNYKNNNDYQKIQIVFSRPQSSLCRKISTNPFVPQNEQKRNTRLNEIIKMQSYGLVKRLQHINCKTCVIGLSGGLDSTLAILITYEAFKILNFDLSGIIAITMPCFGTTNRTYSNACNLAKSLGVTLKEINIEKAVLQHFKDINQDLYNHDVTYENAQARERTQVLMDIANQCNGLVIGTGDLSELALGWATYNGDHMSMYAVNASVPKTLMRYLVNYFAQQSITDNEKLTKVLLDILDTPVSPELLPATDGVISQKTEELVGPYELHDFFLFYFVRYGFSPKKIFYISQKAFEDIYDKQIIKKWLIVFCKRFFSQQFKRSCLPDGVAIGSVSLSPRSGWKMPSDASSYDWVKELDE